MDKEIIKVIRQHLRNKIDKLKDVGNWDEAEEVEKVREMFD